MCQKTVLYDAYVKANKTFILFPDLVVKTVTPASVATFLRTSRLQSSLPILLSKSDLKTEERLRAVLNYCRNEDKSGLPLLLTQDNILRVFNGKVFSSEFFDLLSQQKFDLFLHQTFSHSSSSFNNFVKEFNLNDLVGLANSDREAMMNPAWQKRFWQFVVDRMSKENLTPETVSSKIPDWKVFPVQKGTTERSLLQMKDAKLVVYHRPIGSKQMGMSEMLKKLKSWELNPKFPDLSKFCSALTDFEGLIQILTTLDFGLLGPSDHNTILAYFEDAATYLSNNSVQNLKTLPLYETYDGVKVSLARGNFRILVANIPEEGFDSTQQSVTFLKHNYGLCKLHQKLGLKEISELEVYSNYILETFKDMNGSALLIHLKNLQLKLGLAQPENDHGIVNRLKHLRVIGTKGSRKLASDFFSHKVEFFKKMLPKESLLPKEYQLNLFDLCKVIGLQCNVTDQLFLKVATDLANGGKVDEDKSRFLVSYLDQKIGKLSVYFLQELSSIKFIPAFQIAADLKNLHVQFGKDVKLICFRGSVPSSAQHLVWTSANLLPRWPELYNLEMSKYLGIDSEPSLAKVLHHCKTLCNNLSKRKSAETTSNENSAKSCSTLTEVMKSLYRFLMKFDVGSSLSDVPCIVVEEGRKLVFPRQVSIEISKNDLRPHLFKLPLELGEFHAFFCKLGATSRPTLKQFSDVLNAIHESNKDAKLNPEDIRLSVAAIRRFFSIVDNNSDFGAIESLFFLAKDGSLKDMNTLTFSDRPKFADRVKDYDCEDPATYKLELKDLEKLPEKLRPKFLSDLVTEKLDPNFSISCDDYDPACFRKRHFDLFLSDVNFSQGLTRLCKHFCSKTSVKFDDTEMRRKLNQIGSIYIECRPRIKTLLFNAKKFEDIPGSEKRRNEFVDVSGSIFLNHESQRIYKSAEILTRMIAEILDNYIADEGVQIVQNVLNLEDAEEIEDLLNDEDVTLEPNFSARKVNREPGDPIEDEFLRFLTQNPSHYFKKGELVGYFQNDVYVLAKIVSDDADTMVTNGGDFNFGRKYTIDLGKNGVRSFI